MHAYYIRDEKLRILRIENIVQGGSETIINNKKNSRRKQKRRIKCPVNTTSSNNMNVTLNHGSRRLSMHSPVLYFLDDIFS